MLTEREKFVVDEITRVANNGKLTIKEAAVKRFNLDSDTGDVVAVMYCYLRGLITQDEMRRRMDALEQAWDEAW